MASTIIPASSGARQPGLNSFIVYDHIPQGCITFEAGNHDCEPHIHCGDFVIVDTTDTEPTNNELFLIEWQSGPVDLRKEILLVMQRPYHVRDGDGELQQEFGWWMGAYRKTPVINLFGEPSGPVVRWSDGPYSDEGFAERVIGKVVGVFQPDFRKLLVGAA